MKSASLSRIELLALLADVQAWNQWRRDNPGAVIDLRWVDLHEADLSGANLHGADLCRADLCRADLCRANLCRANLCGANLREANIDYSCWPIWCGGLGVKIDSRLARELVYFAFGQDCDDEEYKGLRSLVSEFANEFHRVGGECKELK